MRLFALLVALCLWVAACGQAPSSAPSTPTTASSVSVNPARIDGVRAALPSGYEVAALPAEATPVEFWGLGPSWAADPPRCASLADPVAGARTIRGWSGSGTGGIVYAVVAGSTMTLDPPLTDECRQWSVLAGRTSGTVAMVAAPTIEGATTVGLSTTTTTAVEGGIETHSHDDTFIAYLGNYVAFVTVVSDPGSPNPPLGQDFAAELLVKTVSAIRG